MQVKKDFLVEIQTEELPPKSLSRLAKSFLQELQTRLTKAQFEFKDAQFFATPRRLAILIKALTEQQPTTSVERRGPALAAAYDSAGKPSPACLGFAKSCGVTVEQLTTLKNAQGEWVSFQQSVPGKAVQTLLPTLIEEALAALPIAKRMRWGNGTVEFVRPVKSVILLYGDDIIDAEILGVRAGRETAGHRFHCKKILSIPRPSAYVKRLAKQGFVIADFEQRKKMLEEQAHAIVAHAFDADATVKIAPALLDEVTGLVEWPVAILGDFDQRFLDVPAEALISAMQEHQRYFPVLDKNGKLLPHFVAISNIEARDMQHVIAGNERVLRARLSDAAFFFETDKKTRLADRVESLKNVVFQAKLGSLWDKAQRLATLTARLAALMQDNTENAKRAGLLAKADLMTTLVGEFPELQGTAGYYYAQHDGEAPAVADAIKNQYLPRFAGDALPESSLDCALSMADRLDTLVGIFGIHQQPTGDKDPFALRRAALGILRMLIEKKFDLDLREMLQVALDAYSEPLPNANVVEEVLSFMFERLKYWYQEQGINSDVFAAVAALGVTKPYDFHRRIQAVQNFKQLPDAESLSIANKRVSNILTKNAEQVAIHVINKHLFESSVENDLDEQLEKLTQKIQPLSAEKRYEDVLIQLADLRKPVDAFFDTVMVMAEDKAQRENRLLLLTKLRTLFLQVADVALLQPRVVS